MTSPLAVEDRRLRASVLRLSACTMALLSVVWVGTYAAMGLWLSAALPFVYQAVSAVGILGFDRTGRDRMLRTSQLWMSLLLPFALQWSLGGFGHGSAVSLWAFTAPLGALLIVGPREAAPWFAGFGALVAGSGAMEGALSAAAPRVSGSAVAAFFVLNVLGVTATAFVLLQHVVRARERALTGLEIERAMSERLLLNVLPPSVAKRLKQSEEVIADSFPEATVLFADIVGFTPFTQGLAPAEVVRLLDRVFARWDSLAARHGVEKIKTIGDSYMAAAGLPTARADHAEAVADMALEMGRELQRCLSAGDPTLEVRIGIATGPVVAGVIGRAKFAYDLWGHTVNMASRMESHGLAGAVQVTERAYEILRPRYDLCPRGTIDIKGIGPTRTYLLLGPTVGVAQRAANGRERPSNSGSHPSVPTTYLHV
jgi:adenylate cyclase